MSLPPLHRIDCVSTFVPFDDLAWNFEKINTDIDNWDGKLIDHPMTRYLSGLSRYDLETVMDYIDMSKNPYMFVFRRLNLNEHAQIRSLMSMGQSEQAKILAVKLCLTETKNLSWRVMATPISDSALMKLADITGKDMIYDLGEAIIKGSNDLTYLEKKV